MQNQEDFISIYGARVHNLKEINLKIPRNKLVVITGKSGSGKSSLAFDTIHAEGQRRYLETFNAYARQFIGNMKRPDVDKITGLSPVVAIEQKTTSKNPRSTVGTITEIYDYLRLLYSRVGVAYSYVSNEKMISFTDVQILDLLLNDYSKTSISILSPIIRSRKGHYQELFYKLSKQGYLKARVNGEIIDISPNLKLDRYKTHNIEVVIDRIKVSVKNKKRLMSSLKLALNLGDGVVMIVSSKFEKPRFFSRNLMCPTSGIAYKNPEPSSFSFNSPRGSCQDCNGLGVYKSVDLEKIMPNKNLSINKGGLSPLEKNNAQWILNQLEIIGKKHGFSLNTPLNEISEEAINYILYGVKEDIKVKLKTAGISKKYKIDFMGIVNFIEEQASFSSVKSIERWANKYMSSKTCKSCNGSRLNIQSSNFKVDEKTITEVVNMDIDSLKIWLENLILRLNNKHKLIADQIVKELLTRVQFIIDVGLSYLT